MVILVNTVNRANQVAVIHPQVAHHLTLPEFSEEEAIDQAQAGVEQEDGRQGQGRGGSGQGRCGCSRGSGMMMNKKVGKRKSHRLCTTPTVSHLDQQLLSLH